MLENHMKWKKNFNYIKLYTLVLLVLMFSRGKYCCTRATELYIFMTLFAAPEHFTGRNNNQVTRKLNEIDKWSDVQTI